MLPGDGETNSAFIFMTLRCHFFSPARFISPRKRRTGQLTKEHIQQNPFYRFLSFMSYDSDKIVRDLEHKIKSGVLGFSPILNGTQRVILANQTSYHCRSSYPPDTSEADLKKS